MIKSIKMKNVATYSSEGSIIQDCQKVNFFYGANGSGKSTISNFLFNPTESRYSDCEIEWENNDELEIVVYNREFRERNIKETVAGIFTLGQATIDEIEALKELKSLSRTKQEHLDTRESTLKNKYQEEKSYRSKFRETIWNKILKKNEDDFQEAFSGFRNSKERFCDEVIRQYNHSHLSTATRESLLSRTRTLFSKKPERCEHISFQVENLLIQITEIEASPTWGKIIVGNNDLPIGKLIASLGNADWVNQGRKLITNDRICPFCQSQTITAELREQLDAFFSGEYEQDVAQIKRHINQYNSITKDIVHRLEELQGRLKAYPPANIDSEKLDSLIELIKSCFDKNNAKMLAKEKEPSRIISLESSLQAIESIVQMVASGNTAISNHNQMVDNYTNEKNDLISDIWSFLMKENEYLIAEYLQKESEYRRAIDGIKKGIDKNRKELEKLNDKIIEAGKNITSIQPTVDEINRSLKSYGFTNFQIVPSKEQLNSYQIQRMDGTLATNTLSEGEETFISFLYFLQLAKGAIDISKVSSRRVLVLDDPICSLDSTVLYIVSSMVKKLIMDVRKGNSDVSQIFILTHNVFFTKKLLL